MIEAVMEEKGIKELKEAVKGVVVLGTFLIKRLKDGIDWDDAEALFKKLTQDEEFKKILKEAVDKADQIPAEVKDVSLLEGVELIQELITLIPEIQDAFKKEEK